MAGNACFTRQEVALSHLSSGLSARSPDFIPPWSLFPCWTLSYCLEGRGRIDFKDTGESFFSRRGHVSIAPANRAYRGMVISKCPGNYHWIQVKFEIHGCLDPLAYLALPHVLPQAISQRVLAIGQDIVRTVNDIEMSTVKQVVDLHGQGFSLLKLLSDNFPWLPCPESSTVGFEQLTPVIDAMKRSIGKRMDIGELAQTVAMSLSSFHRHFKRTFGVTPYAFMEKLRMREAADLLCRTEITIDELAERLGYCDRFQFSKAFKRFHGNGPSQFRRNFHALFSQRIS